MYVYMYVCMYVCMYVRLYVFMSVYLIENSYGRMHGSIHTYRLYKCITITYTVQILIMYTDDLILVIYNLTNRI